MKTAESDQSAHFNDDNHKEESLESASVESLTPSITISEVKDILEGLGFVDGQNGVCPLNQNSTEVHSRASASNESRNENKLLPSTTDGNPVSGNNFEMQYRIENKRYICLICEKSTRSKSHFIEHSRTHSGEKPYVCDECEKKFARKDHLSKHLLTPTGEKSYVCNECEKRFTQKAHLSTHLLTHTGGKPYVCNECEKRFAHNSTLDYHLLTHSGEKPYICNLCQKGFYKKYILLKHMKTHTGK